MMQKIAIVTVILILLFSCKKEVTSDISGSGTITYKSYPSFTHQIIPSVQGSHLNIENVDVYPHILGDVEKSANTGEINGKLNWMKDIQISNVMTVNDIYLKVKNQPSGPNFVENNLVDAKLIYFHQFTGTNNYNDEVLAVFQGYNQYGEITFKAIEKNLTKLFKENPGGRLRFELTFSNASQETVGLEYQVNFSYDYIYKIMEAKK